MDDKDILQDFTLQPFLVRSDSSMDDKDKCARVFMFVLRICSDSSMDDKDRIKQVAPFHKAFVQIPLWTIRTWWLVCKIQCQ